MLIHRVEKLVSFDDIEYGGTFAMAGEKGSIYAIKLSRKDDPIIILLLSQCKFLGTEYSHPSIIRLEELPILTRIDLEMEPDIDGFTNEPSGKLGELALTKEGVFMRASTPNGRGGYYFVQIGNHIFSNTTKSRNNIEQITGRSNISNNEALWINKWRLRYYYSRVFFLDLICFPPESN